MIALLRLIPLWGKAAAIVALVGALGTTYVLWRNSVWNEGYQAAIQKIAEQDKEAVDAANEARRKRRDCSISGGVWNASSGFCDRR